MGQDQQAARNRIVQDVRQIFGARLEAVVAYGAPRDSDPLTSLVLVSTITLEDLDACAAQADGWARAGLAIPLLLTRHDFARSLDAFPIEYGEILATHEVWFGSDPFAGLSISRDDLRRACEVQAKSHLLHLREDYVASRARRTDVDALVRESAPAFGALLRHLARLDGDISNGIPNVVHYAVSRIGLDTRTVDELVALGRDDALTTVDTVRLFPRYLAAMEQLAAFVDHWAPA